MNNGITIPLFPLGLVLLPLMPLPLHIFEERYKSMIGECLQTSNEFGIVYFNGSDIQAIGGTARHPLSRKASIMMAAWIS